MRASPFPLALAALSGALLGFTAALLWKPAEPPLSASSAPMALRPPPGEAPNDEAPNDEAPNDMARRAAPGARAPRSSRQSASDAGRGETAPGAATERTDADGAAELRALRERERVARAELALARQQIAQLEAERAAPTADRQRAPSPRPPRSPREFDLTPGDWRDLAARSVMKYRLPCDGPPPSAQALDRLGLAPSDQEIVQRAFESSALRQRSAILPLCAAALGERLEAAQELSTESCRQVVLGTADARSESPAQAARNVALFMAGDAPRPGADAALAERLFLVLAEEAQHLEIDLADALGPEDAERLIFSSQLCFRSATHSYSTPENAGLPPSGARDTD